MTFVMSGLKGESGQEFGGTASFLRGHYHVFELNCSLQFAWFTWY